MTFEQARAEIKRANDHPQLFKVMRWVSAVAYWPTFTGEQQQKLRQEVGIRNSQLANEGRAQVDRDETKIGKLVPAMGDPDRFR
ncbi:MAG: hypothetical protein WC553_01510 [Patescibacteria group bacterium]